MTDRFELLKIVLVCSTFAPQTCLGELRLLLLLLLLLLAHRLAELLTAWKKINSRSQIEAELLLLFNFVIKHTPI